MERSSPLPHGPMLFVSVSPGYGGAERSMEIILRNLPAHLRVSVLAECSLHIAELRQLDRPGMEIHVVKSTDTASFDRAVRRLITLYMQLQPSAILANTVFSARILAAAARCVPNIAARSFVYVRDFLWPDLDQILPALPGATILVPHRAVPLRPGYLEPFVVPRGKLRMVILPDMVELQAEPHSPVPANGPILHLATINSWKGHAALIGAAAKLKDAGRPIRVRSLGYNSDEDLYRQLEQQIRAAQLETLFTLEPYVRDPSAALQGCRCVVVASETAGGGPETFGRSIIEAWSHGRPVVAVAAGAPATLIRHQEDGLLVPEGDINALAMAIRRLADDDALCQRLGQAGLARARSEFAAPSVVASLLAVLTRTDIPVGQPAKAPEVVLDLTRTLDHGWLPPMGLSRVEAEVLGALQSRPDFRLGLLRYDPGINGYRMLNNAEMEWVNQRFGIGMSVPEAPLMSPRHLTLRDWLLSFAGLAFSSTSRIMQEFIIQLWRMVRTRRQASRAALPPASSGPASGAPLPDGQILVTVANPWDYAPPDVFIAWRAAGRRIVGVVHDLLPWEVPHLTSGREVRGFIAQSLAILGTADHLVAVSAHSAASYEEASGSAPGKTSISIAHPSIVPAIRTGDLDAAMPATLADGRAFIMYCSTIEVRKNHHLLLRIWERLRRRLPENLLPRLVFIGRWGWGIEPIRLWVERDWRMAPHLVVLEGITDDVLALLYRRALFTVFPSFAEGFGMPVAESLACGTPVLTGTHPALREASEGLMPAIDPDDLLGWESMILALLQSPERIMDLRAAAARYRGAEPGLLGRKVANATERFLLHSSV